MANRLQIKQHELAYSFIKARDGEYCLQCRVHPLLGKPLQIDHADNDPMNWDPNNVHLLCQAHNLEMRGKTVQEHKELIEFYSARNERERERDRGTEATSRVKDLVDFRNASPEMKANSYYENQYRDWLLTEIKEKKAVTKDDAINSGAEVIGSSPLSTTRYLKKMTSSAGVLKEIKDAMGNTMITFK